MVADDQEFQEQLVAEFEANRDDIPKYIGRKDTLLHYAFLEAMRVQPVLRKFYSHSLCDSDVYTDTPLSAFTLPEAASVDKELSGFKIPKGVSC